jgi:hypothetical protein
MDSVIKEQVLSGVIGGFAALALAYVARKYVIKRFRKGGKGGRRGPSTLTTMPCSHLPKPVAPISFGKMITLPNGSIFAWSSGQLGMKPEGAFAEGEDHG